MIFLTIQPNGYYCYATDTKEEAENLCKLLVKQSDKNTEENHT